MAQPTTALSPEWDRWFDETFTDLITGDADLTRAEFDALTTADTTHTRYHRAYPTPDRRRSTEVP